MAVSVVKTDGRHPAFEVPQCNKVAQATNSAAGRAAGRETPLVW